jgi:hypothetical protein
MKQFIRHKTKAEIVTACSNAGYDLADSAYEQGSDYVQIAFRHQGACLPTLYNTFNGTFRVMLEEVAFTESSDSDAAWYEALLSFLYVAEEGEPALAGGAA